MKNICLFFFFSTLIISCHSRKAVASVEHRNYIPYYLKMYRADSLYLQKDYKNAYVILDDLFKEYEPLNLTLYFEYENYVKTAVLLNKKQNYTNEITKLLREFGYNYEDIQTDSLLNVALSRSSITKESAIQLHEKYVSSIDTVFRKTLHEMNVEDQWVRNKEGANLEEMMQIGKKHDSILRNYIEKNGYPNDRKIGTFRKIHPDEKPMNLGVAVLLNHLSTTASYNYYFEKLLPLVKNGTCPPKDYAQMIDRRQLGKFNSSIYYLIPNSYHFAEKYPEKAKEINAKRKLLGLPSLEYEDFWYEKRILN